MCCTAGSSSCCLQRVAIALIAATYYSPKCGSCCDSVPLKVLRCSFTGCGAAFPLHQQGVKFMCATTATARSSLCWESPVSWYYSQLLTWFTEIFKTLNAFTKPQTLKRVIQLSVKGDCNSRTSHKSGWGLYVPFAACVYRL